jgi:integrase
VAYITKRNGRWQAAYRGPDRRERTKTFDRKVDAERWLDVNGADIARGAWVDPAAGKVTLRTYAEQWLEQRQGLRPTTRAKYQYLLDFHILPSLGDSSLAALDPGAIRAWHARLSGRHPSTAAGAYRLVALICRTAVDDERIGRTPCKVKGGATEKTPERPTASIAEVTKAAAACPERYRLAVLLAAWCQLRRGEILGLQRRDIDPLHGTVSVVRTWTLQSDGVAVIGPPKTEAGVRTLTIPSNVSKALDYHLARFVDPDVDAWLFPGSDGEPVSPRTIDRAWTKARVAAGRADLHFHDLRHSGLTWAAATGASTAELMRRAGHRSHVAAVRYQHATTDRDRVLAEALADLADTATVTAISRTSRGQGKPAARLTGPNSGT